MKTVNINKKRQAPIEKQFRLGNGNVVNIGSKRAAGYFIAETNRYLTKCLVITNETYCNVFLQYRALWLVATNYNSGVKTNYFDVQKSVRENLDACSQMMDKFNFSMLGSNDPFFSFIDLKKAACFLMEAAASLEEVNERRNFTVNKYSCLVLKERCMLLIKNLNEYTYTENK